MKIKTIRFQKLSNIVFENDREVKGIIICLAFFAGAMIIGAGFIKSITIFNTEICNIISNFLNIRQELSILSLFFNSILINYCCLLILILFGMSCIGIPFGILIVMLKGFGMGILSGLLFSAYKISGIGYYLLIILPGGIIANSALIFMASSSCFFSSDILSVLMGRKHIDREVISPFLKKGLIMSAVTVSASLIDCIFARLFSYLFVF